MHTIKIRTEKGICKLVYQNAGLMNNSSTNFYGFSSFCFSLFKALVIPRKTPNRNTGISIFQGIPPARKIAVIRFRFLEEPTPREGYDKRF